MLRVPERRHRNDHHCRDAADEQRRAKDVKEQWHAASPSTDRRKRQAWSRRKRRQATDRMIAQTRNCVRWTIDTLDRYDAGYGSPRWPSVRKCSLSGDAYGSRRCSCPLSLLRLWNDRRRHGSARACRPCRTFGAPLSLYGTRTPRTPVHENPQTRFARAKADMDVPPTNPYTIGATVDWQLKSPGLVVAVAFPAFCDRPGRRRGRLHARLRIAAPNTAQRSACFSLRTGLRGDNVRFGVRVDTCRLSS